MGTERFRSRRGNFWGASGVRCEEGQQQHLCAGDFGHTSWEELVDEGDMEAMRRSSPRAPQKCGWRAFACVDVSYISLLVEK